MTEHTPGPWRWYGTNFLDAGTVDEPTTILNIGFGYDGLFGGDPPNEADALLIAAAPDLLEALQSLIGQYVAFVAQGEYELRTQRERTQFLAEHDARLNAAQAAIAKALGREASK